MSETLVQTPNGTFVTAEVAEAHGLAVPKAVHKTATRKSTSSKPAARKAAGARRKGK